MAATLGGTRNVHSSVRIPEQTQFFRDLKDGTAVALGVYRSEAYAKPRTLLRIF
jgi:hypothetical protein